MSNVLITLAATPVTKQLGDIALTRRRRRRRHSRDGDPGTIQRVGLDAGAFFDEDGLAAPG